MRVATLREFAARHRVPLPSGLEGDRYMFRDFPHFIQQWMACLSSLGDPADFTRLAEEFCEDEAAQGVRYAEVHFSLPEHGDRLGRWEAPIEAVLEGFDRGGARHAIPCRLVVDAVRGIDLGLSRRAMEVAVRYRDAGVVALGLGGSERFAPRSYAQIFREACDAGLHSVPHAGESAGPESIRAALEELDAERVGHGIRILEDSGLVAEVRDRGVALDVCPTSNVMTRVVASIEAHPLPHMLAAGLRITLNSDDPAMFSSPLAGEYELARRVFGLDDEALADLARSSVHASFADELVKSRLITEIDAWLAQGHSTA